MWRISQNKQLLSSLLCVLLSGLFLVLFLFKNQFSFNYELDINNNYLIFALAAFSIACVSIGKGLGWMETDNDVCLKFLLWVIILAGILIAGNGKLLSNEHLVAVYAMLVIFYINRVISDTAIYYTIILLCLGWLFELCTALKQILLIDGNFLSVKGTLHNSGVLSCYLVIHLPLVYYLIFYGIDDVCKKCSSGIFKYLKVPLLWLLTVCVCYVLYKTMSRTSMVALLVALSGLLYLRFQKIVVAVIERLSRLSLIVIVLPILIGAVGLGNFLFRIKMASATGRLLLWKVTIGHAGDHFWLGAGLGRGTWAYPQWQALYFKGHADTFNQYFLNAGESYILFNEFLQLFVETGFLGFMLFLVILCRVFRARAAVQHDSLVKIAKLIIIICIVCAITSYPFHVNSILFVFTCCLAVIFKMRVNRFSISGKYLRAVDLILTKVYWPSIALLLFFSAGSFNKIRAVEKWAQISNDNTLAREKARLSYDKLYAELKENGKFLTEYGAFLAEDSADCYAAIKVLEEAKQYFICPKTFESAGIAYQQVGDYARSIDNFEYLSNYLPSTFWPKYKLLDLYNKTGQIDKARAVGNIILKMPVKIPSTEIDRIRHEARLILNEKLMTD